ncbi:MAG: hypothetical protein J5855_03100 [Mailhella sp.]|nr:hypothetical protein [Mailhella sp.]
MKQQESNHQKQLLSFDLYRNIYLGITARFLRKCMIQDKGGDSQELEEMYQERIRDLAQKIEAISPERYDIPNFESVF